MKNRIEFLIAELLLPIEFSEVPGNEIAAVSKQVFEIAGTEVIDDGEARIWKLFLQSQGKI